MVKYQLMLLYLKKFIYIIILIPHLIIIIKYKNTNKRWWSWVGRKYGPVSNDFLLLFLFILKNDFFLEILS